MSGEKGAYFPEVRMSSDGGIVDFQKKKKNTTITVRVTVDSEKTCQWVVKLLSECFKNIVSKYLPTDYLLIDYLGENSILQWSNLARIILTR